MRVLFHGYLAEGEPEGGADVSFVGHVLCNRTSRSAGRVQRLCKGHP